MSRRDNDPVGQMPKMTPAHDEIASFKRNKSQGSLASSLGDVPNIEGGGRSSGGKGMLTLVIVLLLAVSGWAAFLHYKLQLAEVELTTFTERVSDLERRLSVTDESMSESSVAMKVKVREMDSEIRKLWDNVWKKSKQRFAEYDSKFDKLEKGVQRNDQFATTTKQQLSQNTQIVSDVSVQLKNVESMKATILANQQKISQQEGYIETASDKVNRLSSDLVKINRRVESTEEWVESINGFRKQVNRDMGTLKKSVGQLQSPSTTP